MRVQNAKVLLGFYDLYGVKGEKKHFIFNSANLKLTYIHVF